MPYKDKGERAKAVKRHRDYKKGLHETGITGVSESVMLSRPNGADYDPNEMLPDGRYRYLGPLSDGQVLDRMTVHSSCPDNVGCEPGQHPFNGMNSVIFMPTQRSKGIEIKYDDCRAA